MMFILGYPPVKCVNEKSLDSLINELVQNDYYIYQLNGENIYDSKTFYNICIDVLPTDPPLAKKDSPNFDAFSDSIRGGISEQESDKVAVIWTKAQNIANNNLNDLFRIIQIFYDISTSLSEDYFDRTIDLLIFLVDNGQNFPVFDGE